MEGDIRHCFSWFVCTVESLNGAIFLRLVFRMLKFILGVVSADYYMYK